jgi:methyltransferase-like protein 6
MEDGGGLDDFYAKKDVVPKFWRGAQRRRVAREEILIEIAFADKYDNEANRFWDKFYQTNTTHFFKDRHWLTREFPELLLPDTKLLEIGCGVGNTIFPLLQENPSIYIYGVDFAAKAIELVKVMRWEELEDDLTAFLSFAQSNEAYNESRCQAFVCDISRQALPPAISSVDIVTAIFVLSALTPERVPAALSAIHKVLRPGGILCFRDYAVNDGAHKKMTNKKCTSAGKKMFFLLSFLSTRRAQVG